MYIWAWAMVVILSLWASVAAFLWALHSGQFTDQERARYLALCEDLSPSPNTGPPGLKAESYALMAIGALGLLSLVVVIALSIYWMKG